MTPIFFIFLLFFFSSVFPVTSLPTAYLIPHSHCDPGWKVPLNIYFEQNVSRILSTVTSTLFSDSSKRFIWSEIVFLDLWWNGIGTPTGGVQGVGTGASETEKKQFREIVKRRQFEFVGGGWVMNDEAVTRFEDIILQISEGHRWLENTFSKEFGSGGSSSGGSGAKVPVFRPQIGWQIDPFGAGLTLPWIHSRMAYTHHIINRIDDRLKLVSWNKEQEQHQKQIQPFFRREKHFQFEFVPLGNRQHQGSEIFTEVLFDHYSAPKGFDFGLYSNRTINPLLDSSNIVERSLVFADLIKERLEYYRTELIAVPMGDDFRYQNAEEQFKNLDMLVGEISQNPELYGLDVKYATWGEYYEDLGRIDDVVDAVNENERKKENVLIPRDDDDDDDGGENMVWPRWVGGLNRVLVDNFTDFFPYSRCLEWNTVRYGTCAEYWTGFYTSYPYFVKSLSRQVSRFSRWAETLFAFPDVEWDPSTSAVLQDLRRTISLMQHHDTITGTFLPVTRDDSVRRLNEAVTNVKPEVLSLAGTLLRGGSLFPPKLDFEMKQIEDGRFGIVVFNSLSSAREEYINVTIRDAGVLRDVRVITDDSNDVPFDLFEKGTGTYELFIFVNVPQLGYRTYIVENGTNPDADPIVHHYKCAHAQSQNLTNSLYDLRFFNCRSWAIHMQMYAVSLEMSITFLGYESWQDDAYKFRPKTTPTLLLDEDLWCTKGTGRYVQELIIHSDKFNIVQTYRLFTVPMSAKILPAPVEWFFHYFVETNIPQGREIVIQFTTSVKNGNAFHHDSNGLDLTERKIELSRYGDQSYQSQISGNYYPMTSVGALKDSDSIFMVMSRSSVGIASTHEGTFEIMLNRNTLGFNPGQINANVTNTVPQQFLFYIADVHSRDGGDDLWWRRQSTAFENPLQLLYVSKVKNAAGFLRKFVSKKSILENSVDPSLHSFSLERRSQLELLLRFQNLDNMTHSPTEWSLTKAPQRMSHSIDSIQEVTLEGFVTIGERSTEFPALPPFELSAFQITLLVVLPAWARYLVIALLSVCFFAACVVWWCVVLVCIICLIAKTRRKNPYRNLVNDRRVISSVCSPSDVNVV